MNMSNAGQRAFRNGGILSLVVAGIGLYQGESIPTIALTFLFAWLIMGAALWLSYKLTAPKTNKEEETHDSNA